MRELFLIFTVFVVALFAGHQMRQSGADPAPDQVETNTGGLASQLGDGSGVSRAESYSELVGALEGEVDPSRFAKLFHLHGSARQRELILLRWAEDDPESALAFLNQIEPSSTGMFYYAAVFRAWAAHDPEAAFANCIHAGDGDSQNFVCQAALDAAAPSDPDAAFRMFFAIKKDLPRNSSYSNSGWMMDHPAEALSLIAKYGEGVSWSETIRGGLLRRWVERDSAATLAWAKSHQTDLNREDIEEFVRGLAKTDTAAAVEFFSSLSDSQKSAMSIGVVAATLGEFDPNRGLEFVDAHLKGAEREDAIGSMLQRFAKADPTAAAPYVEQLGGTGAFQALNPMMETWAKTAPHEAIAWIDGLASDQMRRWAHTHLGADWFRADREAVDKYLHSVDPDDITPNFLNSIVHSGFGSRGGDPKLGPKIEWLESLPEEMAKVIVNNVFGSPAREALPQAASAALTVSSDTLRASAIATLVRHAKPAELQKWIAAQEDDKVRAVFTSAVEAAKEE